MTSPNSQRQSLQLRAIQRKQVQQRLALAAAVALLSTSCYSSRPATTSTPPNFSAVTNQNANEDIPAVFYKSVEECEADTQKQAEEYAVLEAAFKNKELATPPTAPPLKTEDCGPQIEAAKQAHQQHAPNYASLEDCQAEGLECEKTTAGQNAGYYRPQFGGFFFYPFLFGGMGGRTQYIYVNDGGSQRRLYQPSTVYKSATPGQVVTPNGRVVSDRATGFTNVPRHTSAPAPQRPKGTAARGTVTGRGSRGFGSTYKGTGRGGK